MSPSTAARRSHRLLTASALVLLLTGCAAEPGDLTSVDSAAASSVNDAPTLKPDPEPELKSNTDPSPNEEPAVAGEEPSEEPPATAADPAADSALALLATIPVKGRAPKTGYDRKAMFGSPWLDIDRNGCDTRNDILQRDLTDLVLAGPCKVMSGTLADKYTGKTISFVRGNDTSTLVQIDHVVALSDAWQKGAQGLSQEARTALANDPVNLFAADGPANSAKGDGDAATWLPKNREFRCEYVAHQVSVKAAYALWVTQAEQAAMQRVLETCPEEPAAHSELADAFVTMPDPAPSTTDSAKPQGATAPRPSVQPAPPSAPEQAPQPVDTYFKNCTAAREAGAAPVHEGQPGYGRHLDRDGDGVGCE